MTPHTPLLRRLISIVRRAAAPPADGLSRREFLGKSAAAVVATLLAAETSHARVPQEPIAIIGAGAAGLTAALRLVQAGAQVEIFEASNRIGGRIFTLDGFITPELNDGKPMFCELGGELVDSNHKDLISLAKELRVEIQELKKGDPGVEYYHFEGKTRTDNELIPAFAPLAMQLAKDARGLLDKRENYTAKARKFDGMSIADYLRSFDGKVEPWVIRLLDVAYEIEYGRATKEQSALNLITYLSPETKDGFEMYGESDESKRVKGGNSRLIEALEKAIAGKVKIHAKHRLIAIAADPKGKVRLTFDTPDGPKEFAFSKTICALPFTMLRSGRVGGLKRLGLSKGKLEAIEELGYGTNTKAMIAFKSRIWRKAEPVNNGSTYSEQSFQACWETSRGQDGPCGILTNFLGGKNGAEATPKDRFDTTLKELGKVFPGAEAAALEKRVMMHWPTHEFILGSYACPLVGQVTTVLENCATPELRGRLLFAGEHTSANFSGFMCGAIESGNRVAKEALGRV
ncbi:MAG: NAD(P)/FAD-dependent oxidoreductase [Chthoniobacteraceae bacterium]